MTTSSEGVAEIVEVATRATTPAQLHPGNMYAWMSPTGQIQSIDLTGDAHRDTPRHKAGTITVLDLPSFVRYWNKHHDEASELYIEHDQMRITAVLDADLATSDVEPEWAARWGKHRLVLQAKPTDAWLDWNRKDRRELGQREFAEWIEDHLGDIREPNAAVMLEIAQTFQTQTKVKFASATALSSGDRRLNWEETSEASAGATGNLKVPAEFTLGLQPFEWSDAFPLTARFRYRVEGGQLRVTYLLNDPNRIVRLALNDLVDDLEHALNGLPADVPVPADATWKVMVGTPSAPRTP